jgi:hypothetical protein
MFVKILDYLINHIVLMWRFENAAVPAEIPSLGRRGYSGKRYPYFWDITILIDAR